MTLLNNSLATRFIDGSQFAFLFFKRKKDNPERLYDILNDYFKLGKKTEYINYGYWSAGVADYDSAASALADKLAEAGEFHSARSLLDVGFGFGDQDIQWATKNPTLKISAMNVTRSQIRRAKEKLQNLDCRDRVSFQYGSAVDIPFDDCTFDRVSSLEAAPHFLPRTRFFAEAQRCLKPGGIMILADMIASPRRPVQGLKKQLIDYVDSSFLHCPRENFCSLDEYRQQLIEAGFVNIEVTDISKMVLDPFEKYLEKRLKSDGEFRARTHSLLNLFAMLCRVRRMSDSFSYVLTKAVKA